MTCRVFGRIRPGFHDSMIGTRVAHYEITNHLGSGGMGDVYQATDLKLRRNVAIKILPEAFARHADRAMRFEHEAHVLASLNHPNIAALYGLEESGGLKFLVMELVVGETLAERIKRGRIAINEALPIAKQIADGIEGAHEKGIVHRDLKPANIKLTPDGKVKILDFGLAKAFQEPSQISLSNTPTLISASASGVILGTPAYMSPEQAKGKEADRSSDIWAFGCVLYEMITGYAAYEGETVGEILERVFKAEPNWSRLPADTPEGVRRFLRRCMQRDRNRRLQTPGDARIEIEEAFTAQELKQGVPGEVIGRRDRVAWVIAIVATILMTVFAFLYLRVPSQSPEMRLEVSTPATEDSNSFALSPDGRRLIFVASQAGESRLWLRPLDVSIAQPLAGTEGASSPFFSPDGQSV